MKSNNLTTVLLATLFALSATVSKAEVVIDSFDTAQSVSASGTPSGPKSDFNSTAAAEARGGNRDMFVERTSSNSGAVSADVNNSLANGFSYASGPVTTGNALVVWDGADATSAIDYAGLAGVDLTQIGLNDTISMLTTSDLGASLRLTIYTSAVNYSYYDLPIAADPTFTLALVNIPFASFTDVGTGADFTNVGAIEMKIDGSTGGVDVQVDELKAIPEPSAIWLVLLSAAGALGVLKRRA